MRPMRRGWTVLLAAALLVQGGPLHGEDWPQFRGPNCSGISSSKKKLPLEFSATKNVRWSAVLGDGVSSPVVAAGRVFCTGMADLKSKNPKLMVYAFDAASGKKLWQQSIPAGARPLQAIHEVNSYASATPAACILPSAAANCSPRSIAASR